MATAQATNSYGIKPARNTPPQIDLSRRLVHASLELSDIYESCNCDGELMEAVDAVLRTGNPVLMGKVFAALTSTYIEIIAHRHAEVEYDGPTELDAVRAVLVAHGSIPSFTPNNAV